MRSISKGSFTILKNPAVAVTTAARIVTNTNAKKIVTVMMTARIQIADVTNTIATGARKAIRVREAPKVPKGNPVNGGRKAAPARWGRRATKATPVIQAPPAP
jgi:hypothetical protein